MQTGSSKLKIVLMMLIALLVVLPAVAKRKSHLGRAIDPDKNLEISLISVEDTAEGSSVPTKSWEFELKREGEVLKTFTLTSKEASKFKASFNKVRTAVQDLGPEHSEEIEGAKGVLLQGLGGDAKKRIEPLVVVAAGPNFSMTLECGTRGSRSKLTQDFDAMVEKIPTVPAK